MTTPHRIANVLTWLFLAWAFIWICLFGIPGVIDRLSRHEAQRAGETRELVSEKLSEEE